MGMGNNQNIIIPIDIMLQEFGGNQAVLNTLVTKITTALAPVLQDLGIKINPESISTASQLADMFRNLGISIQQSGNEMNFFVRNAEGLQSIIHLTREENETMTATLSTSQQRISNVQELRRRYEEMFSVQQKLHSLEMKGDTQSTYYQYLQSQLRRVTSNTQEYMQTLQELGLLKVRTNAETNETIILGQGEIAMTARKLGHLQEEMTLRHQAELSQQQQNQAAQNYLATMNQLSSAEVKLHNAQTSGAPQASIAAQQQLVNVLQNRAAHLKSLITDERLLQQIEEQLTVCMAKRNAQMQQGTAAIRKQQSVFGSLVSTMKMVMKTALMYSIAYGAIYEVVEAFNKVIDTVKELDKATVDLQIVTGKTREEAQELVATYSKMAQTLGSTTMEVAEAAIEWQRQGYEIEDANTLIRNSMILSKVGMLDSAEAQKYLTSAMKGYNVSVEDSIKIVDQLTKIDMNAAVSAGGLAEAMSKTANSADLAGVEMEQLLGYLAVVGETTQKSMSSVGESFKTIFARFGNIKAGKFVDDETGEDLNDVAKVLSKFNIQLYDAQGNMNDVGDILSTIANRWDKLTDAEQNAIATAVAGTRQRENFLVLMENYGKATEYTTQALGSAGTAEEKFSAYTEGIEAKLNAMTAAFESFSQNLLDSGVVKGIVDFGTGLLKVVDALRLVPIAIGAIVVLGLSKLFKLISTSFAQGKVHLFNYNKQLTYLNTVTTKSINKQKMFSVGIDRGIISLTGLNQQQQKNLITRYAEIGAFDNLTEAQIRNLLATAGVTGADQDEALASIQATIANKSQTVSMQNLTSAMWKNIAASLKQAEAWAASHWYILAIIAAVAILIGVVYLLVSAEDRARDATQENIDKLKELTDNLEETNNELKTTRDRINELTQQPSLTLVEQAELRKLQQTNAELELMKKNQEKQVKIQAKQTLASQKSTYNSHSRAQVQAFIKGEYWIPDLNEVEQIAQFFNPDSFNQTSLFANLEHTRMRKQTQATEMFTELGEILNTYDLIPDNELTPEDKAYLAEIKKEYQALYKAIDPVNYSKIKWEEFLNLPEFTGVEQDLQKLMDKGLLTGLESAEEINKVLVDNGLESIIPILEDYGIEIGQIPALMQQWTQANEETANSLQGLQQSLDEIINSYETLTSVVKEYNTTGAIGIDSWKELLDLSDEYLKFLVAENGQIQTNVSALKTLMQVKIDLATIERLESLARNLSNMTLESGIESLLIATKATETDTAARLQNVMAIFAQNSMLAEYKDEILNIIYSMMQLSQSVQIGGDALSKAEKATEDWEKVLDYVNKTLDDQIDKLEKEREEIEKGIEEKIKAKEKEIELLEAEKEALEDKNDEKNREIELEELQRNLQKARQRTMRVYREDLGTWVWETDKEAEMEATQELEEFYTEQRIDEIDKRIEAKEKEVEDLENSMDEESELYDKRLKAIDKQIEKAEEYKEKWNSVKNEYDLAQSEITAKQLLGATAEADILNGRITTFNTFKDNYTKALGAVASETEKAATRINSAFGGISWDTLSQMWDAAWAGNADKYDWVKDFVPQYTTGNLSVNKNYFEEQTLPDGTKVYMGKNNEHRIIYGGNATVKGNHIVFPAGTPFVVRPIATAGDKESAQARVEATNKFLTYLQWKNSTGSKYASGTHSAKSGLANVDEKGNELIVPKQGRYRMMEYGDTVVPHNLSQRLFEVATNPVRFVANALNSVKSPILSNSSNQNSSSVINIGNIELPSVTNGQSFIKELQIIAANR